MLLYAFHLFMEGFFISFALIIGKIKIVYNALLYRHKITEAVGFGGGGDIPPFYGLGDHS